MPHFFKEKFTEKNLQIRLAEHCLELLGIPHPPDKDKLSAQRLKQPTLNLGPAPQKRLIPDSRAQEKPEPRLQTSKRNSV